MTKQTYYFKRLHPDRSFNVVEKEYYSLNGTIDGAHHEFLKDLNAWNRQGDGKWVYWEVSEYEYTRYRDRAISG